MIRARAVSASGAVSPGGGHDAQSVARRRRSSSVSEGNRYAYHHLYRARFIPTKLPTLKTKLQRCESRRGHADGNGKAARLKLRVRSSPTKLPEITP